MGVAVEIAVQDPTGVRIALAEGADRVELCTALAMGGLTPSAALIAAAVEEARREERDGFVHVLVRPRGGGFVYDAAEVALTVADIRFARATGAAGVVVGALDEFATVDGEALRRFVDAAEGLPVTFHRAFDIIGDQATALEELIALGVGRVLTSGGASRTIDGVATLRALAQRAAGRIEVMAGEASASTTSRESPPAGWMRCISPPATRSSERPAAPAVGMRATTSRTRRRSPRRSPLRASPA
ncbi:copper homeostasis protein CutC [Leifsonia poae]|uniref:copper homeostasis protein CutC n=1 Tax=Leifsonia poae TaxID=110933 RepID=UPI003D69A8F0